MDEVSENTRCGGPDRKQVYHGIRNQSRSELETVNGMGNTAMGGGHSEDYSRNLGKKKTDIVGCRNIKKNICC